MVTVREILRGGISRFLPTAGAGAFAILLAFDGRHIAAIQPAGWVLLGGLLLAETTGFMSVLWQTRYRLEAQAEVGGRRSVIAGALGIVGLFAGSIFSQGFGLAWATLLAAASGAIAAGVTFWPWMRRRVSEQELAAWEAVDVAALQASGSIPHSSASEHAAPVRARDLES